MSSYSFVTSSVVNQQLGFHCLTSCTHFPIPGSQNQSLRILEPTWFATNYRTLGNSFNGVEALRSPSYIKKESQGGFNYI